MKKRCRHPHTKLTWANQDGVYVRYALHCHTCGERLSLGESNDAPAAVTEGRAAELAAASVDPWYEVCPGIALTAEAWGWSDHETGGSDEDGWHEWHAGWLARELATHDHRGERDAKAWSWDPTRPVTDQGPGQAYAGVDRSVSADLVDMTAAQDSRSIEDVILAAASSTLAAIINAEIAAGIASADAKQAALDEGGYGGKSLVEPGQIVGLGSFTISPAADLRRKYAAGKVKFDNEFLSVGKSHEEMQAEHADAIADEIRASGARLTPDQVDAEVDRRLADRADPISADVLLEIARELDPDPRDDDHPDPLVIGRARGCADTWCVATCDVREAARLGWRDGRCPEHVTVAAKFDLGGES